MSKESLYNSTINESVLDRQEVIDPSDLNLLTYSKPHDVCNGVEVHLANMAGGFPFECLGHTWKSVEHLYLCGEFSDTPEKTYIQEDILTATSGYAAKRYKKNKHKSQIRKDYPQIRLHWMLWCVWQKCLGNADFRNHLLSFNDDIIVCEVVKNDPVWACYPDENGILCGGNAMGKILTICKRHLQEGTEPNIDFDLLNNAGIYILGEKVDFKSNELQKVA